MRSFWFVIYAYLAFLGTAIAQEHHHHHEPEIPATVIDCTDPDVPFGHYGYLHCTLHKSGAIQELMARTGKNCCDGGMGGECRATTIVWKDTGPWANLDGMLCPVHVDRIFFDINLPSKVFAVVCAGPIIDKYGNRSCPNTYCAAAAPGI